MVEKVPPILIITSSLKEESCSDALGNYFLSGAHQAGYDYKKIRLRTKKIKFCDGCQDCLYSHRCRIEDDDMNSILEDMKKASILVFVTPIYFGNISGLLKTFLDRTYPLLKSDYKFRRVYLVYTAQEDCKSHNKAAIQSIKSWTDRFPKAKFIKAVEGVEIIEKDDIAKKRTLLRDSFQAGASCYYLDNPEVKRGGGRKKKPEDPSKAKKDDKKKEK